MLGKIRGMAWNTVTSNGMTLGSLWQAFTGWFTTPLFSVGENELTLSLILMVAVLLWLLNWLSRRIERFLGTRLRARSSATAAYANSVATIARYVFLVLGALVVLQNLGVNLMSLGALAGALGIGIGFGLKDIVNNFVSGLIILFERPIKVGDRIEIQGMEGDVIQIGSRSTRIRTNDRITIIVPNSSLIQQNVVNWTANQAIVRFKVPITVGFGQPYEEIEAWIVEAVKTVPEVAEEPPPSLRLMSFGDAGLNVEVRAWSTKLVHRKGLITSKINAAIYAAMLARGQTLPNRKQDVFVHGAQVVPPLPDDAHGPPVQRDAP